MSSTPATRLRAVAALAALVGLVAFASLGSAGSRAGRAAPDASQPLIRTFSGAHPDFVGVAGRRPLPAAAVVLAGPLVAGLLTVASAAVGVVALLGASGAAGSRLRRWRARLVGAPPLVS